jgi:hypothetical protein
MPELIKKMPSNNGTAFALYFTFALLDCEIGRDAHRTIKYGGGVGFRLILNIAKICLACSFWQGRFC